MIVAAITIGNRTRSVFTRALMPLAILAAVVALGLFLFRQATRYTIPPVTLIAPVSDLDATGSVRTTVGVTRLWFAGRIPVIDGDGDPIATAVLESTAVDDGLAPRIDRLTGLTESSRIAHTPLRWINDAWSRQWALRNLDALLTAEERAYLAALTASVNADAPARRTIDYGAFVRSQFALDLGAIAATSVQAPTTWLARSLTAIKKTSSSALVATQLAFPGLPDGGASWRPIVRIVRPSTGYPYVEISTPGLVGSVLGANAQGMFVALHIARTSHQPRDAGRPSATVVRDLLVNAGSLDDAWRILSQGTITASFGVLVYDARRQTFGWFEHANGRAEWVKRAQGPVFGDGLIGAAHDDSDNDRGFRVFPVAERQKRMASLLGEPIADARAFATRLSDRTSTDALLLPLGHRAAVYDPEAWATAIFDPGSMRLWIAEDATRARWQGIDIPTASGATSLAASAAINPADFTIPAVVDAPIARQALAAARQARLLYAHNPALAEAFASKAFALAPTIPIVLETTVAVLSHHSPAVLQALLLRWEVARPDNRDALEQARAALAHP